MNRLASTYSRRVGAGSLRRLLCAATALAACAIALPLSSAAAQEAPVCLKGKERLDDGINKWNGNNGRDSVTGLRGRDHLNGHGGNDFINGGRDNDVVEGGDGSDLLCGGRGGDVIRGGPGDDIIYGEEENDRIIPGPGDDKVLGSAGNDRIFGWGERHGEIVDDGVDILDGGFNDDLIEAGGADSLYGYTHNDTLSTKTPLIAPAVMDGGGNDDVIYGSEVDDNMNGGERLSGRDKLFGAGGNDTMTGAGNDDELYGQLGDDNLSGADGFDFLDGGPGDDHCDGGDLQDMGHDCDHESSIERHGSSPRAIPYNWGL
jgi:Ca2+-binding RTX toxin-like protein